MLNFELNTAELNYKEHDGTDFPYSLIPDFPFFFRDYKKYIRCFINKKPNDIALQN